MYIQSNIIDNTFTNLGSIKYFNTSSNTLRIIYPSILRTNSNVVSGGIVQLNSNMVCSDDGKYVYITRTYQGPANTTPESRFLYSLDFGTTWNYKILSNIKGEIGLSCNSNGNIIGLIGTDISNDNIQRYYRTTDFGENFILLNTFTTPSNSLDRKIVFSNDGRYQLVIIRIGQLRVYRSDNFGINFTEITFSSSITNPANLNEPNYVAISQDGKYQTIILYDNNILLNQSVVFTSNDYGNSFTSYYFPIHQTLPVTPNSGVLSNITMDLSGRYQILSGIYMYFSEDYGQTWNSYFNDTTLLNPALLPPGNTQLNKFGSTTITKNGKIFYTSIFTYIGTYNSDAILSNQIYKWEVDDPITLEVEPSQHHWVIGDLVEVTDNSDSFLNDTYTISSVSGNTLEIFPNVLITPTSYTNFGNITNLSRIHVITNTNTFTQNGQEFILLENSFNTPPQINISQISNLQNLIKLTLTSPYYLCKGEYITLYGTNGLDGTYQIQFVEEDTFPISNLYITSPSENPDVSFIGIPYLQPEYNQNNTLKVIAVNSLQNITNTIYITNNDGSPLSVDTHYKISEILGPNSFLIEYIHLPESITTSYNITGQGFSILALLNRNQDITMYRIESVGTIPTSSATSIGGIPLDLLNNKEYQIEKMIDTDKYIINCGSFATSFGDWGGQNVYISSLANGIRNIQYNTVDGTSLTKIFRSISLEGYNYIYLCSFGKETELDVVQSNNTKIENIFAKVVLDQPIGFMCFDSFISAEKNFTTPIPELSELTFAVYTPDGNLYNFNDTNYSLDLEITSITEELEEANIGTKNNNKLRYNVSSTNSYDQNSNSSKQLTKSKVQKTKN